MKQSSCSSFTEKFRDYRRQNSSDATLYDFEGAEVAVNDVRKRKKEGCDYAFVLRQGGSCEIILVECKGGRLGISDFEKAKKQLEYSIRFMKDAFGDPPDMAVICYESCDAMVTFHLKGRPRQKLLHSVQLILYSKKASNYCKVCPDP